MEDNAELFKRASEVIPGGVDSPVRAFGSVGGHPYFVARAEGCYVWDVEGRRYVDYVQSWGASILPRRPPHRRGRPPGGRGWDVVRCADRARGAVGRGDQS